MAITPESSNELKWISIWRLVKPHANYCVDILIARWLRPAFAELYRLLRVTPSKELAAVRVWNAPDQWHNCRGANRPPPAKINVKIGILPRLYFGIYILLVSVDCCFLRFSEFFSGDFGFIAIQYRICYCFSTIFWMLASGLPSSKFAHASNI